MGAAKGAKVLMDPTDFAAPCRGEKFIASMPLSAEQLRQTSMAALCQSPRGDEAIVFIGHCPHCRAIYIIGHQDDG